jgi:hypothetical protein
VTCVNLTPSEKSGSPALSMTCGRRRGIPSPSEPVSKQIPEPCVASARVAGRCRESGAAARSIRWRLSLRGLPPTRIGRLRLHMVVRSMILWGEILSDREGAPPGFVVISLLKLENR